MNTCGMLYVVDWCGELPDGRLMLKMDDGSIALVKDSSASYWPYPRPAPPLPPSSPYKARVSH
jgi:hypothetical protein